MTGEEDFKKKVQERMQQLNEESKQLSPLSLENRLAQLKELYKKQDSLEKEADNVSSSIMLLENMPDVLEHRVRNDDLALALFDLIKKEGQIKHQTLIDSYKGKDNEFYKQITGHTLLFLERAGLIHLNFNAGGENEPIYLTEQGKNFKYTLKD